MAVATDLPYYTCPLKTAFMMGYHGMRFVRRTAAGDRHIPYTQILTAAHIKSRKVKYYVAPESLHLLEPQDDDLILNLPSNEAINLIKIKASRLYDGNPIIHRNGIAFHYPEFDE